MKFFAIAAAALLAIASAPFTAALPSEVPRDVSFPKRDMRASELVRRSACQAPGAVNGQCGVYYSGFNCNDKLGQFAPDVSLAALIVK